MTKFSKRIKSFKDKDKYPNKNKSESYSSESKSETPKNNLTEPIFKKKKRRSPYYFQIGLDFGTAFSKCIYRDVNTNECWVFISPKFNKFEQPFLYPSLLKTKNNKLGYPKNYSTKYSNHSPYHLKWALMEAFNENWESSIFKPYRIVKQFISQDNIDLSQLVKLCAVYYLAGILGEIRRNIQHKFEDFGQHPNDYMAVNMGIPVAIAEDHTLSNHFHDILVEAWGLADQLASHPEISFEEMNVLCTDLYPLDSFLNEACFIVPEVSANLQGFVKSRVSRPGIYLFSDTGAATVDQSIFIFTRFDNDEERLNYLHADVLPFGSSQIEFIAAMKAKSGEINSQFLDQLKKSKEEGETNTELNYARSEIAKKITSGTKRNLVLSRRKLYLEHQLEDLKIIFGGGGHCDYPYKESVLKPFSKREIFPKTFNPDIIGIPNPRDLNIDKSQKHWLPRLSVAYGLSFPKVELVDNRYPDEIDEPKNKNTGHQITSTKAPTKDEC